MIGNLHKDNLAVSFFLVPPKCQKEIIIKDQTEVLLVENKITLILIGGN